MASLKSIKLNFQGEMRRVSLDQCFGSEKSPSMKELKTLVRKSFKVLSGSKFSLQYADEDKDVITVSTDVELEEAFRVAATLLLTVVRFDVTEIKGEEAAKMPASPSSSKDKAVHKAIVCDACGCNPLVGVRYKCSVRPDFDLCEACEAVDNSPHAFLKIKTPEMSPAAILTVLRPNQPRPSTGTGAAGEKKKFPAHWGEPPRAQTKDMRPWPGGYGAGSGTVAKWIQLHMDRDTASGAAGAASAPSPPAYPEVPAAALGTVCEAFICEATSALAAAGTSLPAAAAALPVHRGVTCDKSGMKPIVGARFHVQGANYDLCETEFAKLPEAERLLFVKIAFPGAPKEPVSAPLDAILEEAEEQEKVFATQAAEEAEGEDKDDGKKEEDDGVGRAWTWKGHWAQEMGESRSETVNFLNASGNTLLHFNPRTAQLVLNTKEQGKGWQREERVPVNGCGLVPGAPVDLRIEVVPEGFHLTNAQKPEFNYLFKHRMRDCVVATVEQKHTSNWIEEATWVEEARVVAAGAAAAAAEDDDGAEFEDAEEEAESSPQGTAEGAAAAFPSGGKFKGGLQVPSLVRLECVAAVREFGPFTSARKPNGTLVLRDPRAPTANGKEGKPWKSGGCLRIGKNAVMDTSGNGGPWASYHVEPVPPPPSSASSSSLFVTAMDKASFALGGASGGGGGASSAEMDDTVRLVCGNRKLCLAAVGGKLVGVPPTDRGTHTHFRFHEALPFDVPDPTWEALEGAVSAAAAAAEEVEAGEGVKAKQAEQASADEEFARMLQESWNEQAGTEGQEAKPPLPPPPPPQAELDACFLSDVTVPDGTVVSGGERFTKVWRLRNDGDAPFPPHVRLVPLVACPLSGPSEGVEVPTCVLPLEEFEVAVPMTAPKAPPAGSNGGAPLKLQSVWRLADASGKLFGHKLWVEVAVREEEVEDLDKAARARALESVAAAVADMSASDSEEEDQEEKIAAEEVGAGGGGVVDAESAAAESAEANESASLEKEAADETAAADKILEQELAAFGKEAEAAQTAVAAVASDNLTVGQPEEASETTSATGSLSPSIDWEQVEFDVLDENEADEHPVQPAGAAAAEESSSLDLSASMEGAALAGSALAESANLSASMVQAVKTMESMDGGSGDALGEWGVAAVRIMEMGFTDPEAILTVCRVHCAGPDEVEGKMQLIINDLLTDMPSI
mmetsp:Transcript_6149/g.11543  ORF Transcript_6149/g.11543 Transcript_6149/m.11543 type:complete len:1190 (-) Transcript_6149:311-3880(-)